MDSMFDASCSRKLTSYGSEEKTEILLYAAAKLDEKDSYMAGTVQQNTAACLDRHPGQREVHNISKTTMFIHCCMLSIVTSRNGRCPGMPD